MASLKRIKRPGFELFNRKHFNYKASDSKMWIRTSEPNHQRLEWSILADLLEKACERNIQRLEMAEKPSSAKDISISYEGRQ
jgi:hypothetical protein